MKKLIFILIPLLLVACAPPSPPATPTAPINPTTSAFATIEASPTIPLGVTTQPTVSPTATPSPQPATPASSLFDLDWDDREPFAVGLTPSEQGALASRGNASVYHIALRLSDDLTRLEGREEVRYTNAEDVPLTELDFRLFPNLANGKSEITNLAVNGKPVEPRYGLQDSLMVIPLEPALQPGEQVVVSMDFEVEVPTEPGGNYGTFALLDGILALAHFYPMIAVYDDEGWNVEIAPEIGDVVYSDTSYYLVRVDAPAGQKVLASGVEIEREEGDGREIITFAAGPMRDFYLVSSQHYEKLSQKVGETVINAYAPPQKAEANKRALDMAVDAFKSFSTRFGPYPFTELDVVGTPTLAGGVEYPGIVVVALDIYDPEIPFFEMATVHEVAHQWFYSVVGNDQIDEPWLDESLTQYATLLYFGDVYGPKGADAFRDSLERRWERIDRADIPIGRPVAAYDGPSYSAIVYGRGPLFFDALAQKMGEDALDALLKDYYQTFKWDIATTESFKQLAEKHCGCDLTPLFEEWIYNGKD
ncbi:MAG: M1 family metallopeptidase [Chloroflexi bacterium]|nr:M1 family metallopeptidase [Chloroflexota bacterium]